MKKAVWIIGHGSSKQEWVDQVDQELARVSTDLPIILSFLEKVEGRLIADGLHQLNKIGAEDVLVIPLFVSSASTHIAEIKSMLSSFAADVYSQSEQKIKFSYAPCMDDHDLVIQNIVMEAKRLAEQPISDETGSENVLLLIAHGSDERDYQEKWQQILKNIVHKVELAIGLKPSFKQIDFATFLPYTIENKLKDLERNLGTGHTVIVIPLFLSTGVFTNKKIPQILDSFPANFIKYNSVAYLNPSNEHWIHQWIKFQIDAFQSN